MIDSHIGEKISLSAKVVFEPSGFVKGIIEKIESLFENEDEFENTSNFMLDRQIHFNLRAVQATLARVYLTMGDKQKALEYAEKVIQTSKATLKTKTEVINDLAGVLSQKECLFGVYYANFFSLVNPKLEQTTSYYALTLREDFMEMYEQNVSGLDYRTTAYFTSIDLGGQTVYRLSKFTDIYEKQDMYTAVCNCLKIN